MLHTRWVSVCAVAALLSVSPFLRAQESVASRIVAPIDESRLTVLSGGVSMRARAEFDLGRAPASAQMNSVRLVLSRSAQQEAALEKFMAEQLDPHSPNFRKWLTPDQFGKLYGPSDSDIQTLVTWLQSRGFTLQPVPKGRVSIAFSGSVSQIEAAFHTEIHSFNAHGEEFLSNISDPKIPSALTPVISGIAQLNTIHPRPHNIPAGSGTYDPTQKHFVPADAHASGPTPFLTTGGGTSSSPYNLFLVPADAATIYDTPNSLNTNFNNGTSYGGAGVTIGIGGDAPIQPSTVASYRSQFLFNSTQPTITTVGTAPTNTNDTDEAYIDTELAGGLAPGATINFYTAVNLSDAINQAVEDNVVDIFSLSFGECEAGITTQGNQLINQWWQQAAGEGIAVTVSTGDSGSAGCDNDNTEQTARYGLQVNGYASTPYNIAVGGTDYPALSTSFTTYVSATNSNYYGSALGYIPESTWNASTKSNTTISGNTPYIDTGTGKGNIYAGSGGASSCSTNNNTTTLTNCTSGYAKPSWQTGSGVPSDGVRDLPDVSLFASAGVNGAAWLVCTDDQFTQNNVTYTTNCENQTGGGFAFSAFGGTSTSAPAFAGILALVQQSTGSRLGQAAKKLYELYNSSYASAVFHDTTVGNISVPCVSGTTNCSKNSAGDYFLTGYNTSTGYDLATGLGSVDATQLVNYWSTGGLPATISLTPTPASITTVQPLTLAVSISGSSATPTGSVTLSIDGTAFGTAETLAGGAYSFTIPAEQMGAGSHKLSVSYSGDNTYGSNSSQISITVTALTPTVTVAPASSSLVSNTSLNVNVTIGGSGPDATGFAYISSGAYTSVTQYLVNGTTIFVIPPSALAVGTDQITVYYSGDWVYKANTGAATVTVTQGNVLTPTVTITPSSQTVGVDQSPQITVTVTGSGAPPTGTFTLTSGSYTSILNGIGGGTAIMNIPANTLPVGTDTLTATYLGDSNYGQGSATATITVVQSVYSLSATTPAAVSAGASTSSTVTVSSTSGYSGNITLSCALTTSPTGAQFLPTCSIGAGAPISLGSVSPTSATGTINFATTAPTTSANSPANGGNWLKSGTATLLAILVFLGIPARRRAWRTIIGVFVLIAVFSTLSACGGGGTGGGGGGGGGGNSGTTAGTYTFTVTGTGTPSVSPAPTATITLTVN